MTRQPVLKMLEYRYRPIWRNSFVHYGALLKNEGLNEKFRVLVQTIFNQPDHAEMQLMLLAEIFAACGIKDTTPWVGEDLRKILYSPRGDGFWDYQVLRLNALGSLDAQWLVDKELSDIAKDQVEHDELHGGEFNDEKSNFPHSTNTMFTHGVERESPFMVLLEARSFYSRRAIKRAFWGEEERTAMLAIGAFSKIATQSDTARIKQVLEIKNVNDRLYSRCVFFCFVSKDPSMASLIFDHSDFWWGEVMFRHSLVICIATSGANPHRTLAEFALRSYHNCEDIDLFRKPLHWLARLGGPLAIKEFNSLLDMIVDPSQATNY